MKNLLLLSIVYLVANMSLVFGQGFDKKLERKHNTEKSIKDKFWPEAHEVIN